MKKHLREFISLLAPYRKKVFLAFVAIIIANILGLAFPWAIKLIIDEVIPKRNIFLLNILAGGLVAAFLLKFYFGYIREYLFAFIGEKAVLDLRNKLHWHIQRLSVQYVENTPTGRIISGIISDVESIKNFLFGGMIDFAYSLFNLLFVLAILFMLDLQLTLVSIAFMPVFAFAFLKLSPRLKKQHSVVREKYAELTSRINEVFNGIRIVAGFARDDYEIDRFNLKQNEIFSASMASRRIGIFLWMSSEFLSSLGLVIIIWLGAKGVLSNRISIGTLMAFYSYLGMLFFPIIKMVVINNYYQEASASLERVAGILAKEPEITDVAHPIRPGRIKGHIQFNEVVFSYGKNSKVLSGITLEIMPGQVLALVGKSGSGKTTLINLLLRFYEPQQGAIFIDGNNLKELELKSYRSQIAMVIQDDYLFDATVAENIRYSKTDASDEELMRAAKSANAHEFIAALPDGYNTRIGERGIKLSYGQRQRISISRAILRDPAILILDEATSAVDSQTELLIIQEAFSNLMRGRTTLVISHRPSSMQYADRIVYLEDGRISEEVRERSSCQS